MDITAEIKVSEDQVAQRFAEVSAPVCGVDDAFCSGGFSLGLIMMKATRGRGGLLQPAGSQPAVPEGSL